MAIIERLEHVVQAEKTLNLDINPFIFTLEPNMMTSQEMHLRTEV